MKFLIFSTIISAASAINLILWPKADSCSGNGVVCVNVRQRTCCLEQGKLWGSASAAGGGRDDVAAAWTKRGDLYCGVQITPTKPIPICFVTGLESSVGGISWEHQSRKRMDASTAIEHVEGDEFYSDGVHMYVISKAKMAQVQAERPTKKQDQLEWFKAHADTVIDHETNTPVSKVEVTEASDK